MANEPIVTPRPLNIDNTEHPITIANEMKGIKVLERLPHHPVGRDLEPIIRDLLYAIESGIRFQDQHFRAQLRTDLRNLERRIDNSFTSVSISLVVIPDAGQRVESIALVKSVESAIHVVREIGGLGETQIGIIDELIGPALAELVEILNATASDESDLKAKRSRGLSLIGRVMSLGHAVCSVVGLLDAIEKAGATVSHSVDAAEKAIAAARSITNLEGVLELLRDLYQLR